MTATDQRFNWRLIAICWVVVAAILYLPQWQNLHAMLPFTDSDDSMRMVTATNLADGQGWQDKFVHREDAPFGMPMHWSRIVDAPISLLLLALRPIIGATPATGDLVAFIWPPMLLLGLLIVSVGLARRLVGPGNELAALVLPVLSVVVLGEFSPGRVDHHNVQIILTTALVWATVSGRSSRTAAIVAGILAATSLAIGLETLPFIAGAVLCFSLFWVIDGKAANPRWFALAFAIATLGHFVLATAPALYYNAVCDELSIVYVVGAALASCALGIATLVASRFSRTGRFITVAVLGIAAGVLTLVLFPECRGGPYARLDPRAFELLLAHVSEAQPLLSRFLADPVAALSFGSAAIVGLIVLAFILRAERGDRRIDWLVVLIYLALASVVMMLQVRGARLAVMPAIPAGVWLIARARALWVGRRGIVGAGALLASWLLFAGVFQFVLESLAIDALATTPATAAPTASDPQPFPACFLPHAFDRLNSLPPGNVIGPMILGVRILRYTPDGVVASGYHRNIDGAIDVDDFLNAGEVAAKAIVAKRSLAYVVACRGLPQDAPRANSKSDSFVALYATGAHWDWLRPVSDPADPLQIYQIEGAK